MGVTTMDAKDAWITDVLGFSIGQQRGKKTGGFGGGKTGKKAAPNPPTPVQRFKIGGPQKERAEKILADMPDEERERVEHLLEALDPASFDDDEDVQQLVEAKRSYLLKAISVDHSADELEAFYERIKDEDLEWMQNNLHVVHGPKGKGIKQQWQMSCGPTTLQAFRAEMDPIYALKLRDENDKLHKTSMFSGMSESPGTATEQRQILEQFGGKGDARGSIIGAVKNMKNDRGMALSDAFERREFKNYLGVTCEEESIEGREDEGIQKLVECLDNGTPVPIRVEGKLGGHFALITGYDGQGDTRFSVHDPWDGKVFVLTAKQIKAKKVNFAMCDKLTDIFVPKVADPEKVMTASKERRLRQEQDRRIREAMGRQN